MHISVMFQISRYAAIGAALFSCAALQGCGQAPAADLVMAAHNPAKRGVVVFSLDTPVETIAADRRGKAILQQDIPGLLSNPCYPVFDDMSLSQIALISSGKLSAIKLGQVQTDLRNEAFDAKP